MTNKTYFCTFTEKGKAPLSTWITATSYFEASKKADRYIAKFNRNAGTNYDLNTIKPSKGNK